MTSMRPRFTRVLILALAAVGAAHADEGLWPFNAPPRAQLKANHGFEITDAWLDHLMKSSVRFGASGSFVSGDGLVITNHHVGRPHLQRLSMPGKNYVRDGFHARTRAEELKVPGASLSVLQSIEDVTARVNAAIPAGADPAAAAEARRKIYADLAKESLDQTGLQSNVVSLHEGGQYHLHRYKRYGDVRLVFAPESAIAAFGDDADNFEYPRFCLDVCFFRVYENNAPAHPAHYLKWSAAGARDGELVFAAGHPGNTDRDLSVAELEFARDVGLPFTLDGLHRNELALKLWGARDAENRRRAGSFLPGIENSRKRAEGQLAALQDPAFLARKQQAEEAFKRELAAHGQTEALAAYGRIAETQREIAAGHVRYQLLVVGVGFTSQTVTLARTALRLTEETGAAGRGGPTEPDAATAVRGGRAGGEAGAASGPIHEDLEIVRLTAALTRLTEILGYNDPAVRIVLGGKAPRARAVELIRDTKARDAEFRRTLREGGDAAAAKSKDPMIAMLHAINGEVRALRKKREAQDEIIRQAQATIARARFAVHGTNSPPDATGTLRLSYGPVKGYVEEGRRVPALTTYAGLFARADQHGRQEPFNLPERWVAKQAAVGPDVPFNFVSTTDSVGGNSGSPVVNRAGEFVGILFDGNLHGLARTYAYEDKLGRSISVHSAGIMEALEKVYAADALVAELRGGGSGGTEQGVPSSSLP